MRDQLRNAEPPLTETDIVAQRSALDEAIARMGERLKELSAFPHSDRTEESRFDDVGQGGWLTDLLARASRDDTPAPRSDGGPPLPEQRPAVTPHLQRSTNKDAKPEQRELISRREDTNKVPITATEMTDVIERLRTSKKKQVYDVIQSGVDTGKHWAEHNAEYLELRDIAEKLKLDDPRAVELDSISRIFGRPWIEFWSPILGEYAVPNPYFQIGFVRGAKAVWEQVRDYLED